MRTLRLSLFPPAALAAGLAVLATVAGAAEPAKPAPAAKPAAAPATAAPATVDPAKFPDVVAKVNGYELKKTQLMGQAGAMLRQGQPATLEFFHAVVEQMVGTRLLYEESVAHKLVPADDEVEKAYAAVRQRFQGSDEEFAKKVAESGLSVPEIKQGIRENLAIRNLVAKEVAPTVTVSDADAQKFYDQNGERMNRPEQVNVSHILIGVKPGATPAEKAAAKKKADDLLAKLKAGGDFAELAKENSDDGSKAQGGDLGWISKGATVPPFDAAAFALKPGETSGVVESQFGYHIIRSKEHRAGGKAPFAEAKEQITGYLKEQALREALLKHVNDLRAKAKVEVAI